MCVLFLQPIQINFKKNKIMNVKSITKPITDKLNVSYLIGIAATIAVVLLMLKFFVKIETDQNGQTHFGFNNPFAK